jgi:hypothetical protein
VIGNTQKCFPNKIDAKKPKLMSEKPKMMAQKQQTKHRLLTLVVYQEWEMNIKKSHIFYKSTKTSQIH